MVHQQSGDVKFYNLRNYKMFIEKEVYPEDWGSVVVIEVTGEPIE